MNMAGTRDPYLDLPLEGVRLIEASAGTGKTFTVATLFTRLVVERHLRIGQVLAVTFTEAATQELRRRIRERLALALQLVSGADGAAPAADAPDARLTADLLQAHLARGQETAASLRRRLRAIHSSPWKARACTRCRSGRCTPALSSPATSALPPTASSSCASRSGSAMSTRASRA